jgi:hypothetical protein
MKRMVMIEGADQTLTLSKIEALHLGWSFLHLDELSDGTWKLTYSPGNLRDIHNLKGLYFCGLKGPLVNGEPQGDADVRVGMYDVLHNSEWIDQNWHIGLIQAVPKDRLARHIRFDMNLPASLWRMSYTAELMPDLNHVFGILFNQE